jgi:hypothetical protein
MSGDELGDVRGHAVQDGVGDEQAAEVVRGEPRRLPGGVGDVGAVERAADPLAEGGGGDGAVLDAEPALEQQRHRRVPDPFVGVVGGDAAQRAVPAADPADDRGEDVGEFGADDQQPFGVGL